MKLTIISEIHEMDAANQFKAKAVEKANTSKGIALFLEGMPSGILSELLEDDIPPDVKNTKNIYGLDHKVVFAFIDILEMAQIIYTLTTPYDTLGTGFAGFFQQLIYMVSYERIDRNKSRMRWLNFLIYYGTCMFCCPLVK